MIECEFLPVVEFSFHPEGKTKRGRYTECMLTGVPGYFRKKWGFSAYLKTKQPLPLLLDQKSMKEVILECLDYLNSKLRRGINRPIYGILQMSGLEYRVQEKGGEKVISGVFITDDRKNKNFWGEGLVIASPREA